MAKQPIPAVSQGKIKLESGEVMEFESSEARAWLVGLDIDLETGKEKGRSFRYESMRGHASFTARNQHIRGIAYFYGSKKVAGKVHKIYIGKLEDLTIERMETIAENIIEPKPKAVDKKPRAVVDEIKAVEQDPDRIVALEAQIAEMRTEMQQALEELRGKLTA